MTEGRSFFFNVFASSVTTLRQESTLILRAGRCLAAALATAMTVMSSLGQSPPAAKPDGGGAKITEPANTKTLPAPLWVREPIGGPNSGKFLRVADTRGMGETVAALLALGVSDKNAVILLVQGENKEVIADARRELSALILAGQERVGLIIGDGSPDIAYIYSKGHKIITLKDLVKGEDRALVFDSDMHRIYLRDVTPLSSGAAPLPSKDKN